MQVVEDEQQTSPASDALKAEEDLSRAHVQKPRSAGLLRFVAVERELDKPLQRGTGFRHEGRCFGGGLFGVVDQPRRAVHGAEGVKVTRSSRLVSREYERLESAVYGLDEAFANPCFAAPGRAFEQPNVFEIDSGRAEPFFQVAKRFLLPRQRCDIG
ncbi:MAG: hypothetical protein M3N13_07825, partial [Candidatus Eremiobacteraeota bacterium]|nr:hypothetical protein [Candidatus Eremiobacteraeota bacterium]